jgi:hypothetical protein
MIFKITIETVERETYEIEAESEEAIKKHWELHRAQLANGTMDFCDCKMRMGAFLNVKEISSIVIDLQPTSKKFLYE